MNGHRSWPALIEAHVRSGGGVTNPVETEHRIRVAFLRIMGHIECGQDEPTKAARAAPPVKKSSLFNFRDDRIKATTLMGESAETEFARYLDNHDTAVNLLEFFKSHKSPFPKMFKMIPQITGAPGSTAAVEGIFSVAGYILSPRRMSFTDENFENHLFANLNRGIFEVSSNKLKLC